jgi:hypothetical protein
MDKNKNNEVYEHPQMFTNIFKYGPEYSHNRVGGRRNVLFKNPELDELRAQLLDEIGDLLNKGDEFFQTIVNESIINNFPNIINTDEGDNIQELIDNSIRNIEASAFDLSDNLTSWSFDVNQDLYTFTKVSINTAENNDFNLCVNGDIFSNSMTTEILNTNRINFNIEENNLISKIDNELHYKDVKITNLDPEEIFNNISAWSIDINNNTYTYSNVGINSEVDNSYELKVGGNTLISDALFLKNSAYKIHVKNSHLYFNNCRLDKCDQDSITFYLCFDYHLLDLCVFDEIIKEAVKKLDPCIDFTYLQFFVNDIVQVTISVRDDICINDSQKLVIMESLKKIYNLVVAEELYITVNNVTRLAIANIYLLNEYYHYEAVDSKNAFKLVKKNDEDNNKALLSGQHVYLKNLNNEYLQPDYTFSKCTDKKLLLEVHGYRQNFNVRETCIINRKDSYKLEVLPPVIIDEEIISLAIGDTKINNIIIGEIYMDNINLFDQDTTWQNPGIDPRLLTDDIYLSDNIEQYITDPEKFNDIFLVDERWLTFVQDSTTLKATYYFTFNDDHDDSKKFIAGQKFCEIIIADFVFNDSYKLESIEEHGKYMFKNKHLPALSSVYNYENYINIYNSEQRREDIVLELEKAHIYIYELNDKIKDQGNRITELEEYVYNN